MRVFTAVSSFWGQRLERFKQECALRICIGEVICRSRGRSISDALSFTALVKRKGHYHSSRAWQTIVNFTINHISVHGSKSRAISLIGESGWCAAPVVSDKHHVINK